MGKSEKMNTSQGSSGQVSDDDERINAIVPNPEFTLPAKRLAGSPACLNCGTGLQGPFCHYCGQPDRNFMRFFPALLRELLTDFLDFDSRFARTLKPLMFKPGRLTRDYLDGRRFRYTPPMRLYLFSSIAFFLIAALTSFFASDLMFDETITVESDDPAVEIAQDQELEEAIAGLPPETQERIRAAASQSGEKTIEDFNIQFGNEPWDPETNPVAITWVPDSLNRWINDEIAQAPQKGKLISENPRVMVQQFLDIMPATVFVMLPVVALIFKFWYLFSRRYYIEHLVLALHNHSFIFVCLILLVILESLETWFAGQGMRAAELATIGLNVVIACWIPIYLIVALRTVYQQSWWLTVAKGLVIGFCYLTLLAAVTVMVGLLGFLLV